MHDDACRAAARAPAVLLCVGRDRGRKRCRRRKREKKRRGRKSQRIENRGVRFALADKGWKNMRAGTGRKSSQIICKTAF